MTEERWVDIPGFDGVYQISDKGKVRHARSGNVLAGHRRRWGMIVCLCRTGGKKTTRAVHNLVSQAFLGETPPGHRVAHRSGDKADNTAENLEWRARRKTRPSEPKLVRPYRQVRGEWCGIAKLTTDDVLLLRKLRVERGLSFPALAKQFGVSVSTVYNAYVAKTWKGVSQEK